jgi:segregation and condensation protein B
LAVLDSFGLASIKQLPEPKEVTLEGDELEEQTQLLFERFEGRQMTLDEVKE